MTNQLMGPVSDPRVFLAAVVTPSSRRRRKVEDLKRCLSWRAFKSVFLSLLFTWSCRALIKCNMSLSLSSIHLPIHLSIYPSIHLSTYPSIYPSIHPSINPIQFLNQGILSPNPFDRLPTYLYQNHILSITRALHFLYSLFSCHVRLGWAEWAGSSWVASRSGQIRSSRVDLGSGRSELSEVRSISQVRSSQVLWSRG